MTVVWPSQMYNVTYLKNIIDAETILEKLTHEAGVPLQLGTSQPDTARL